MTFHVGQKVVCVDDSDKVPGHPLFYGDLDGLKEGRIYTVRKCLRRWDVPLPPFFGSWCVKVEEIHRLDGDPPYLASRFRPVTERKTDISIFTEMLTGAPNELERVEG